MTNLSVLGHLDSALLVLVTDLDFFSSLQGCTAETAGFSALVKISVSHISQSHKVFIAPSARISEGQENALRFWTRSLITHCLYGSSRMCEMQANCKAFGCCQCWFVGEQCHRENGIKANIDFICGFWKREKTNVFMFSFCVLVEKRAR